MKTRLISMLLALALVSPLFGQFNKTKRVAILEIVDKEGKIPRGVELMIRGSLSSVVTNTPGYEGYDRVDIASIMNEHDFQRTGLVNDSQIKQLGKMAGADYILIAEAAYLNESYILITAKILNVESARLENTAYANSPATVEELDKTCRILAEQLLHVNIATGATKGELQIGVNKYNGEYKNRKPNGRGKMYYANGEIYEGEWLNGQRHGKGILYFAQNDSADRKSYEGDWVSDVRQGNGTMIWNDGERYVGGWKSNVRYGKGIYYYSDGDKYDGNWADGKKEGAGTYYYASGDKEKCNYRDGKENGYAIYYFKEGNYWKGYYVNGQEEGKWECYNSNGHHTATKIYEHGVVKRTKYHN